ncbi:YlcI/YnfO family protein [Dermacoccus sp. NHGro5]|uniref:YlcI/YnfO family protein n=1 Tax=Dermacoccus sp. NHGro5 TaxID=2815213 RepID=UPI0032603F0B
MPQRRPPLLTPRRIRCARHGRLSSPVPVRFPAELLEEVKSAAQADDRSVSAWIRRAVEHELRRSA